MMSLPHRKDAVHSFIRPASAAMGNEKETSVTVQATESTPSPQRDAVHHPQHQERPKWLQIALLIIDIGLALSPILFLGIAFAAIAYNHKNVDHDPVLQGTVSVPKNRVKNFSYDYSVTLGGQAVIDTAQIAVSIFPILFAAVVGRFMKSYALHRAERGSSMGVLEQLYGSQNLANAVQLLVALRGPGLMGIAVVFVWILSPIGGQGVKRVLGTRDFVVENATTVYYCNTSSSQNRFSANQIFGPARPALNDAFGSLLFTDSNSGDSDVWGNVKIPYLTQAQADNSTWTNATADASFSSMAGLLIDNLPLYAVTSFNITTSYVRMTCEDARTFKYTPPADNGASNLSFDMTGYQDFLDWAGPLLYNLNMTNSTNTLNEYSETGLFYDGWQYIVDVKTLNGTWTGLPTFVFATQTVGGTSGTSEETIQNTIYAYQCASSLQWLEANLQCTSLQSCSVLQTRPTSQPASVYHHPLLDASTTSYPEPTSLYQLLSLIGSRDSVRSTGINYQVQTTLEKYIAGNGTYATQIALANVDFSDVTGREVATNLGSIINTVWLLGVQYLALARPPVDDIAQLLSSDPNTPEYQSYPTVGYDVSPAPATQSTTYTIYQVSWIWIVVAIVISLLLLFLGLLGVYFRYTNKHPDVLGFVSTLTRDNPNFDPPPQAEKLDGMEMANYYKHTKVQLVNTAEMDDQARITLRKFQRSSGDM